jgi:hypothetical protein
MERMKSAIIPIVWALTGFAGFSLTALCQCPMRQARLARPAHIPINGIGKSSGSPGEVVHYMHMMNVSHGEFYLLDTLWDDDGLGDKDTLDLDRSARRCHRHRQYHYRTMSVERPRSFMEVMTWMYAGSAAVP